MKLRPKATQKHVRRAELAKAISASLCRSERDLVRGRNWPGKAKVRARLVAKDLMTSQIGSRASLTMLGQLVRMEIAAIGREVGDGNTR